MSVQRRRNCGRGSMSRSCTSVRKHSSKDECFRIHGKSALMLYDKHPELHEKWNKAFWARGYYVATVGNVTESAIKKYIQEQSEETRKEDSQGAAL